MTARADENDSTEALAQNGTAVVNFGGDAPLNPSTSFALVDTGPLDGQLHTLDGQSVTFALSGGDLLGTVGAGSTEVIRLHIVSALAGPAAGHVTYTYSTTLSLPVKHANGSLENSITLTGVTFQATDQDGDPIQGTFNVTIVDDVPSAVNDTLQSVAEDFIGTIGGNVMANDTAGADGAQLTHVNLGAGLVAITSGTPLGGGVFQHSNTYGVYTFKADGTWTFDPNANLNISGLTGLEASFNYQLTDGDNDLSNTALQPIRVLDAISFSIAADVTSISEEAAASATFTISTTGFPLNAGNTATVDLAASGSATGGTDYTPALLAALAGGDVCRRA